MFPKKNDILYTNNYYDIIWHSTNFAEELIIDLLVKNELTNQYDTVNIGKNIPNQDNIYWGTDEGIEQVNNCKLLFRPSRKENSKIFYLSNEFVIKDTTKYYLKLFPPKNNNKYYTDKTYPIKWATNFIGKINIDLIIKNNQISVTDTTRIAENINDTIFNWHLDLDVLESDSCRLIFTPSSVKKTDIHYLSSYFSIIDTSMPPATEIKNISIVDGYYKITWDKSNAKDVKFYAIYKSSDKGHLENPGYSYTFSSTDTLLIDNDIEINKDYYYKIAVYDKNNNRSPFSSIKSTIMTDVENEPIIPIELSLEQNYPNPFNPKTNISFSIPKGNNSVTLRIYNNLGQLVETLLDKKLSSGKHNISFDGSNLSSGIYIYSLQVGSKVLNKKLILLK